MKILLVNCLDYRYGLAQRARTILNVITDSGHEVTYLEPNYTGSDPRIHTVIQKDNPWGYLKGTISRVKYCLLIDYDLLFVFKLNLLSFPIIISGMIRKKKIIVDWDDLDSEFQKNIIRKFFSSLIEKYLPKHIPMITTHNDLLKDHILKTGAPRVSIVPQVVDTDLFNPEKYDRMQAKKALGLEGKIILGYLGTLTEGGARDLDIIIGIFRKILNHRLDTHLLIIGGGPLQKKFENSLLTFAGKKEFTITGTIPHSEVPFCLSSLDIALIYMRDNPGNRMRMSLKLMEYLAMNLITIGHLTGATLNQLGKFCILGQANEGDLAPKILDNLADRPKINQEAKIYIFHNFSVKNSAQALDQILMVYNQ